MHSRVANVRSTDMSATQPDSAAYQRQRREFDDRLHKSAFLLTALTIVVSFVYSLLPLGQDETNQLALRVVTAIAVGILAVFVAFPWARVDRRWFAIGSLIALPCIATSVRFSGGWSSPLQAYYFLALVFHASYYHRRREVLALNALTLAFSLSPAFFDPNVAEFSKHLVVNAAVYFALGLMIDAIVQEVRYQERHVSLLTVQRRTSERETARLVALQRAGLLINSRLNAREAMEALAQELLTTLGYSFVTIYLRETADPPTLVASAGYIEPVLPVPPPDSVIERTYRTGKATLVRDVGRMGRRLRSTPGTRSIVSVPVHDGEAVVGVLTVEDPKHLDDHDLELLELFAQQANAALANARRYEQERHRATREEALREVSLALTSTLDPEIVLREVLNELARVLPSDGAVVLTHTESGILHIATAQGLFASDSILEDGINLSPHGFVEQITQANVAHLLPAYYIEEIPDITDVSGSTFPAWIGSLIAAPLLFDGVLRGVILVAVTQRGRYGSADADLVADFARHAAVALHNAEVHNLLARTARTDPLTGLLNHGALLESLTYEVARAERYRHTLSVIFFDLDHFKAINDLHGHQFGEEVLRALAHSARETMRTIDTVGRYGGEEFVVILPETDYWQAMIVAERLRVRVAATTFMNTPTGSTVSITISIGVAAFSKDGDSLDDLIRTADNALYHAKRNGRNRVSGSHDLELVAG